LTIFRAATNLNLQMSISLIVPKLLRHFFFIAVPLFIFHNGRAQDMSNQTYRHKMQLIDSLSLYKMDKYDTIYKVSTVYKTHGNEYKTTIADGPKILTTTMCCCCAQTERKLKLIGKI
jgi:hypothetical protein